MQLLIKASYYIVPNSSTTLIIAIVVPKCYSIPLYSLKIIDYFRYEPTRYVIIASHHDSWHKGAARPGIGHAVLMELVRTLGYEARHNWKPGKASLILL